MPKRRRERSKDSPQNATILTDSMITGIALMLLAIAIAVVFFPLTQFFFAQDDFSLMLRSIDAGDHSLFDTIKPHPGQFRPLSKVLYFKGMYGWFGLDPLPYHVVSLLLHILNTMLFFVLIRRFRLRLAGALLITFLFGLSTSFTNIVAWISCIQQLMGQIFGLLTLIAGIIAIDRRSLKLSILATAAYLLALGSIEQIAGIPFILALYAYSLEPEKERPQRIALAAHRAALPLAAMILYAIFMLIWKRLPGAGPYTLHFGGNVIDNLLVYLDWTYAFSIQIPFLINNLRTGLTVSHLMVLAVVIFNLARGRSMVVLIALGYYFITILPVLPLQNHTFFTHTYIPAFGMFLLLGYAIDEFFTLLGAWDKKRAPYYIGIFFLLIPVMSFIQIQKSINTPMREDYALPRNYVLRRAMIAKTACDDIMVRKINLPAGGKFYMVFMGEQSWYSSNVIASLGHGDAIKLFYNDPELRVFANVKGDTLDGYTAENSQILFYNYLGNFFTNNEIADQQGSAIGEIKR
jgi:hypothetical protein